MPSTEERESLPAWCPLWEHRRAWAIILIVVHLLISTPIFKWQFPDAFNAYLMEAACALGSALALAAPPSSRWASVLRASWSPGVFSCFHMMASAVFLVYLTVMDARWSRSPWSLAFHVLWWPVAVESLSFLGLSEPLLALAPLLLAAFAALLCSEAFHSREHSDVTWTEGVHLVCPLLQAFVLLLAKSSEASAARSSTKEECEIVIRPAGRDCELYNDHIWSKLRKANGIRDDFVNGDWRFEDFESGGGKGGTLMAFVKNQYIVKELSKGDHAVLLALSTSYLEHVRGGPSVLCEILLHFLDRATGRNFFVMRKAIDDPTELYDLKGCADDKTIVANHKKLPVVRKRIWHFWMWGGKCCWSPERVTYHSGKVRARKHRLRVTRAQRKQVLDAIQRDTQWLNRHNLMDYSLLVGEKRSPLDSIVAESQSARNLPANPELSHVNDGEAISIHVCIIDFLQTWNTAKVIAKAIKVLERNKATIPPAEYAERFRRHFENFFEPID